MEELINILTKYNLTIKEYRYRIKNNIPLEKAFTCKHCGKPVKYTVKHHYSKFCNKRCASTYNYLKSKDKKKQTCIERYGVDNPAKAKEVQDKMKQTNIKRYGVDNYVKTDEYQSKKKKTCLKKYGTVSYSQSVDFKSRINEIQDKIKQTNLNKYGVDNYSKTKEFKEYMKLNNDKIRSKSVKTCKDRYGVGNYTKTEEFRNKYKKACQSKYGVDHYSKSQDYKKRLIEIQQKIHDTKKQNNTFHVSSEEEKAYQLLLTKFGKEDIIRQYKSEVYPFQCDFYIKSLDLYIEYNGYWTHGWDKHKCLGSFDKNNKEHLAILTKWQRKVNEINFKGKKKNQFESAIYTWTDLDVRKLETFKKNKLNYKIFWTVKEVKDWLRSI